MQVEGWAIIGGKVYKDGAERTLVDLVQEVERLENLTGRKEADVQRIEQASDIEAAERDAYRLAFAKFIADRRKCSLQNGEREADYQAKRILEGWENERTTR